VSQAWICWARFSAVKTPEPASPSGRSEEDEAFSFPVTPPSEPAAPGAVFSSWQSFRKRRPSKVPLIPAVSATRLQHHYCALIYGMRLISCSVCLQVSSGIAWWQGTASSGYDSDDDLSMSRASDSFSTELSPELRGDSASPTSCDNAAQHFTPDKSTGLQGTSLACFT
jgi:hypothetical protein